ncbi:DNA polymerase III subunit delta [Buchnera aphidicola (Tetraneura ulmi)]
MIVTYPHNILKKLKKNIFNFYIIQGNETTLVQESIQKICKIDEKTIKKIEINIKNTNSWKKLFYLYSTNDIFISKKIFIIHISSNTINKKEINLINNLLYITLKKKNLLIIHFENSKCFKKIQKKINYSNLNGLIIICESSDIFFKKWFENKIKECKLKIEKETSKLLIKLYEGNIFFLSNTIKILHLIYPNTIINNKIISSLINDEGIFNAYQWSLSVLLNNNKKSIRILNKFEKNNYQPIILLRIFQKCLLNMIENRNPKNKETSFFCTRTRITINSEKYYKIIRKLTKIEINYKKNKKDLIWLDFKILSLSFL